GQRLAGGTLMRQRRYITAFAVGIIALSLTPVALTAAKKAPYNDAYSMNLLALKGPEVTDVYATFATDDPELFPVPEFLKVKIKDTEGEVAFIENTSNVLITDGVATMSAGEPAPHEVLYVNAHIKTSTREVVLQGETVVLMRPDLVIDSLSAPDEVVADGHFVVKGNIREANLEVGATATVSLYIDGQFLTSIPGVEVGPGEPVTVAFAGISIAEPGTHELKIVISQADPTEYDETNNEASVSIEVIQILQTSSYSMNYLSYPSYYYYNSYSSCFGSYQYQREQGSWDDLSLSGSSIGIAPDAPIEAISWTVESEKGVHNSGSRSDVAPASSSETWDYYSIFDEDTWTLLTVDVNKISGSTYFNFSQFSGSRLYVSYYRSWFGSPTYYEEYKSTATFMNARQFVDVSLLLDDDAVIIGGTATANLGSIYNYSYYSSSSGGSWCRWYRNRSQYYSRVQGYGSGIMDPATLGKRIPATVSSDEVSLPLTVQLHDNYPNPFNPTTKVRFGLPEDGLVELRIYNVIGREVALLQRGYMPAGNHQVVWNGTTTAGRPVPSGIYFARLIAGGRCRYLADSTRHWKIVECSGFSTTKEESHLAESNRGPADYEKSIISTNRNFPYPPRIRENDLS
ncbi:FlgD immunoglobulin-like domain containing protein, partial [Candidatus Neomarinimicrobiota bacterium]